MKKFVILVFLFLLFSTNLSAKNPITAIFLGISPLPGDGLIYLDQPLLGAIDMAVGLTGVTFLTLGILGVTCDSKRCWQPLSWGAALFSITYLFDLIYTCVKVDDYFKYDFYNTKLEPIIYLDPKHAFAGVNYRF